MCSDPKEIFSSIEDLGRSTNRSIFLALGMFDGVHLGHQKVLAKVNQMAQEGLGMDLHFRNTQLLTCDPKVLLVC